MVKAATEKERKRGVGTLFLLFVSKLYAFGVLVRHWLYDRGFLSCVAAVPIVVSVGNVTAGGSGKTPFVAFLAELLQKQYRVAVVSRGYRSRAERRRQPVCVRDGAGRLASWQECGDEPRWLAERLKESSVIVGKRRVEGVALAHRQGCDVVLLDDGMQHRRLKRDIEIVIVEGRDPLGGGGIFCLMAGCENGQAGWSLRIWSW